MKVTVKIIKTDKGLEAFVVQEGRRSKNLVKRRANSVDLAKTYAVASLPKGVTGIEWELEGVEE